MNIVRGQFAQHKGDLSLIGRLYKKSQTPKERACLLGLLGVEIAYQKRSKSAVGRIFDMARPLIVDDYKGICKLNAQQHVANLILEGDKLAVEGIEFAKKDFLSGNR